MRMCSTGYSIRIDSATNEFPSKYDLQTDIATYSIVTCATNSAHLGGRLALSPLARTDVYSVKCVESYTILPSLSVSSGCFQCENFALFCGPWICLYSLFFTMPSPSTLLCALIDWCCLYYFVGNSLGASLEALCARIFFLDSWMSVSDIFFPFLKKK